MWPQRQSEVDSHFSVLTDDSAQCCYRHAEDWLTDWWVGWGLYLCWVFVVEPQFPAVISPSLTPQMSWLYDSGLFLLSWIGFHSFILNLNQNRQLIRSLGRKCRQLILCNAHDFKITSCCCATDGWTPRQADVDMCHLHLHNVTCCTSLCAIGHPPFIRVIKACLFVCLHAFNNGTYCDITHICISNYHLLVKANL